MTSKKETSLLDQIRSRHKKERLARNKEGVLALSTLLGELENLTKNTGEVPDAKVYSIIKMHLEHLPSIATEQHQVLSSLLPPMLTEEGLRSIINTFVLHHELSSLRDMGKVVGYLTTHYAGQYNPQKAAAIAKDLLK